MEIVIIIQVILSIIIFFNSFRIYEDYNRDSQGDKVFIKEDRIRFPIIFYILFVIFTFIPIVGLVVNIVLIIMFIVNILEEDIYYKFGPITKFLFKKV